MRIIRPIRTSDVEMFTELAFLAGMGVISLPKDKKKLEEKVNNSLAAFSSDPLDTQNLTYLFVMEDLDTGNIVGISGIRASTGGNFPSYYFGMGVEIRSPGPNRPSEMRYLYPIHYTHGPSEICALFLHPEQRRGGWGRLLSFSRFLFIASHLDRFSETIISEIRGHLEGQGSNPFWDAIGRHFYDLPLQEVLRQYSLDRDFIPHILPTHPIYVDLLSKEAQEEIGTIHDHAKPALNFLMDQGFKFTNEIDIIDGGPKIEADTRNINTIKESVVATVVNIDVHAEGTKALIANTSLDFRAVQGPIFIDKEGNVTLSRSMTKALEVGVGDKIRYYITG